MTALHLPEHPVRLITASSLFDGHDASINIMRRIFQSQGCEVIHLGHNRSVAEVVDAALEEDVQGVAVSSYQGGHVEYFEYLVELLRAKGAGHVKVVGGGGGVIVPAEIERLRESGVRIFSPEDGQKMGLVQMVNSVVADCDVDLWAQQQVDAEQVLAGDRFAIARAITGAETGRLPDPMLSTIRSAAAARGVPVLGITGTGGSGKSSLTDELVRRFRMDQQDKLRIAILAVDPTRRKGGGALLGDRIRANAIGDPDGDGPVFFRSLATRGAHELPEHLSDVIDVLKAAGFDLVIVETPGIGQGDAAIVPYVDTSLYVMTPEFGAASQLEKIDMLDFADTVAINKFDRGTGRGLDALRDVARQLVRNREAFGQQPEEMPVFGTSAATFNDDGVTALYHHLRDELAGRGLPVQDGTLPRVEVRHSSGAGQVVPADRAGYLGEIAETVRAYHARTESYVEAARRVQRLEAVRAEVLGFETGASAPSSTTGGAPSSTTGSNPRVEEVVQQPSRNQGNSGGFETGASAPSSTTYGAHASTTGSNPRVEEVVQQPSRNQGNSGGFETGASAPSSTNHGAPSSTNNGALASTTGGNPRVEEVVQQPSRNQGDPLGFETGASAPSSTTGGALSSSDGGVGGVLDALLAEARAALPAEVAEQIAGWPEVVASYSGEEQVIRVRDTELRTGLVKESLSGNQIPRVALPRFTDHGELVRFWRSENLPGFFPFTAGVFPFKRDTEDPARMFAGEGDPARTNRRFKILSADGSATRLSTAFDSVTLYGRDPDPRPDVYGKVGTSGVSVATLDDMKVLYDGFDLVSPSTSVSMTINGPAPTVLAFFLNTVIDQQLDKFRDEQGREPDEPERAELTAYALANVRGTVQADILKEDQGQNTCLFSTEFSLRMMADIQEWFIANRVRNFYSVSISGYHIAEAGANPISQLAFTLANGFTYVEAYLARGMDIDDFAPNLSFFFSNGMDPEYSVIGRVARRIWAVAMRDRYGAGERSQKLKYHVQTSGRSLHAQEMDFNDIRTTLQALIAIYDNANSLHTNAYDEAVTTPTEESVRRALAIQLIINREWGLAMNENPLQGSFIIDELTDLVERAVLEEFDRINQRGGVLGAMETGYQRGRIQDESMRYEHRKHDGSLPIVGVNTFVKPHSDASPAQVELARATEAEKESQLRRVRDFRQTHREEAAAAIARLKEAATSGENVFGVLMDAARVCSLQQVTEAFFEVGGQYRRNV